MGRRARKQGKAPSYHAKRQQRGGRTVNVAPIVVWGMDGQGTHGVGLGAAGDKVGIGIHERTPQGKPVQRHGEGAMLGLDDARNFRALLDLLINRIEHGEDTTWRDDDYVHLVRPDGSD